MKKFFFVLFIIYLSNSIIAQDITTFGNLTKKVKTVIISIETAWNQTGIMLHPQDSLVIMIDGLAATNGKTVPNTILWIGPEGIGDPSFVAGADLPVPGASSHCVVGKIGISGQPFYVGRKCAFESNVTGELYLGLNDKIFWDNYGYYVAFISGSDNIVGLRLETNQNTISDFSV